LSFLWEMRPGGHKGCRARNASDSSESRDSGGATGRSKPYYENQFKLLGEKGHSPGGFVLLGNLSEGEQRVINNGESGKRG